MFIKIFIEILLPVLIIFQANVHITFNPKCLNGL